MAADGPWPTDPYTDADGHYATLARYLRRDDPETARDEVVTALKDSGLRGLGGAAFPTGAKWDFTRRAAGEPKYVRLQRRRERARHLQGPGPAQRPSPPAHRGHGPRRLGDRCPPRHHLSAPRIPPGRGGTAAGHRCGLPPGCPRRRLPRLRLRLRPGDLPLPRGLYPRRGDGPAGGPGGPPWRAPQQAAVPHQRRPVGPAHADEQRGDLHRSADDPGPGDAVVGHRGAR
ncbi:MAG: hypothetical protein U5L11_04735 [Arhodomonas sp.]|nr:hypothetical protein [Arhodomonas sp.]